MNDKKNTSYFTLEKIEDRKTKFTLDYYIEMNPLKRFFFSLTQKAKLRQKLNQSMLNLDKLAEGIKLSC